MKARSLAAALGSTISILAVACGSSDNSQFGNGSNDPSKDPNNGGNTQFGDDGGGGAGGGLGNLAACATSSANGQLAPVNLVFMYDKTGSMKDAVGSSNKWDVVKAGVQAFFADSQSGGMSAQLTFFSGSSSSQCDGSAFNNPKMPLTPLPNATAFSNAISGVSPGGETPTLGAETAGISQAKALMQSQPNVKSVIVMVTDGDPNGCSDSGNIQPATDAAHAAFTANPSIPTYVIGVGSSLTNLNTLAAGGGTTQAFLVDTTNASASAQQLSNALNQIRGAVASGCSFKLPAPPAGQTLDINKVNVVYTSGSGSPTILTYDPACANGKGWHYDTLPNPTEIDLCPNTCNDVKGTAGGKVTIAFGCSTQGGVR